MNPEIMYFTYFKLGEFSMSHVLFNLSCERGNQTLPGVGETGREEMNDSNRSKGKGTGK